jgi:hypothetical protein
MYSDSVDTLNCKRAHETWLHTQIKKHYISREEAKAGRPSPLGIQISQKI